VDVGLAFGGPGSWRSHAICPALSRCRPRLRDGSAPR